MIRFIQKIKCYFGKHDYRMHQKLGHAKSRIICPACKRSFAMADDMQVLLDWDLDFEDFYRDCNIILKKLPWEVSS